MYEHRFQPMLPRAAFLKRLSKHALVSAAIVFGSLLLGVLGYHFLGRLAWIDALVNASMLLGGMGPVDTLTTIAGKLFASFYALYSGIIFLLAAGIIFAPVFHRLLHHFHLESGSGASDDTSESS